MSSYFDIETWLLERSVAVQRYPSFISYTHFTGERSFVALRNRSPNDAAITAPPSLAHFFSRYNGFSVGNDHIILGSCHPLGVEEESQGFVLPVLSQMNEIASRLGIQVPASETVFMAEAAWMFVYSIENKPEEAVIHKYDREFKKTHVIHGLEAVLNLWWEIVLEDPLK